MRTEGEIRRRLQELEANKEEKTRAPFSEQKRISLYAEIKSLKWVLEEEQ